MSIELIQAVIERSKASGADRMILLIYAYHADKFTGLCYPKNETVAKEANCHIQTVKLAKRNLYALGELVLIKPGNTVGGRKSDEVKVAVDGYIYATGSNTLPVANDYPTGSNTLPVPVANNTPQPSYEPSLNGERTHSRPLTPEKEVTEKKRTVQPDLSELIEYCRSVGIPDEAEKISDYWKGNGFRTGRNPIKDWKACVRTWKSNMPAFSRKQPTRKLCSRL